MPLPLSGFREPNLPQSKGLDFFRAVRAKALNVENPADAAVFAEQEYGPTHRATRFTKAAVSGANTSTDTQIVGDSAAVEIIEVVTQKALYGQLGFRRVPFFTPIVTEDEGPSVEWRDEGKGYRTSLKKLSLNSGLEPFDIGAMEIVTKELLRDGQNVEAMLRDNLTRAIAQAINSAMFDPANSGSAGVKPASITNGASGDSNSPSEGLFQWGDSFTGDPDRSVILMHPMAAARISGAARPNVGARGGSWGGYPVFTTAAINEENFIFLDPAFVVLAIDGASFRVSDQAAVEMADSSSQSSVTSVAATNVVSLWQTNSVAIIVSVRANWKLTRPESVQIFDFNSFGL